MTLMCLERSQSPTHKGNVLQGRKSSVNNNNNTNNINQQQNANHNRRNSCSPPLTKNLCNNSQQQDTKNVNNLRLERSISEPAVEKKLAQTTNSSRYKTELCRPFEENGTCKYGDKCQFAHGEKELRSMARHPKYKTELCRTFHSTGLCPYGPRCHFIHNSEQTKKSMMTNLTYSSAGATNANRPKPLTSLGSAGDLSPPSSHGGSPTGTKCFDFQAPLSPPLNHFMFPDLATILMQKMSSNFLENGFDIYDSLYEKLESNDNYISHGNLELDIYSTAPVTPSTPNDTSYNFLPYF